MLHGKEWQALHLENLRTEAGMWMECQFLIPHYENCQKAIAQPQTWVSSGSERSWILALLKGWDSHLFLHPDQHSGTRRDRCSGHIPDGHFRDSLGLLGPSSPKREVAMHMKDAQNLASWHQERKSPACTAYRAHSQTSFSQVQSHRSGLKSALAQMPVERKPLDAQAYRSGNGIWTQFGRYSQVLEKLGLCALSEVIEIQIFILLLPGRKRRLLREITGLIRELL